MKYLVLTGDETREDLEESIRGLAQRRRQACIESTRRELTEDIDELLDMLLPPAPEELTR